MQTRSSSAPTPGAGRRATSPTTRAAASRRRGRRKRSSSKARRFAYATPHCSGTSPRGTRRSTRWGIQPTRGSIACGPRSSSGSSRTPRSSAGPPRVGTSFREGARVGAADRDPRHMDDRVVRTRESYDKVAARFLANTRDRSPVSRWLQRFAAQLDSGAPVLDLGAGPGFDSAALRRLGLRAISLDLSRGMLHAGLREFPGPRVQADARCLPFRAGALAGVWANASLLHLSPEEATTALGEVRRVLRARGLLHVSLKSGVGAAWESERY